MKTLITALLLTISLSASAIPLKPSAADYNPNEINRKNTWQGSLLHQITINETRFGIGLWPLEHITRPDYPFAALIVWTPQGWITLKTLTAIGANGNLNMGTGSPESELSTYMQYLEWEFTPIIQEYMSSIGADLPNTPGTVWEKVLYLMSSGYYGEFQLFFDKQF